MPMLENTNTKLIRISDAETLIRQDGSIKLGKNSNPDRQIQIHFGFQSDNQELTR